MALNNLQLVSDTTLNNGDKEKALDAAISVSYTHLTLPTILLV